jgi:type I restriction enzyme, S subunit
MSRKFQYKAIPSSWLDINGRRLDCGPYMSGAIEAIELLKKHRTEPLKELTAGHNGGIYNGPQFVRNYVEDPAHGVPFLTTSTMLQADLANLHMISRKDAHSPKLKYLRVEEGMTLITCSGSIGRMAFARKDMEGCWSNQDIMKVVADDRLILPGYLYAYLSSRFGVPIVVSGTYGAIIQYIEPRHLAELPVPRLGDVEDQAHELVQRAANLRTRASESLLDAIAMMARESGLQRIPTIANSEIRFGARTVSSNALVKRMDASFHSPFHEDALRSIRSIHVGVSSVRDIAESISEPKRFKRIQVDDEEFGIPMFGTTALMWADPQPSFLIPKTLAGVDELIIDRRTVLIPRSGQVSGIIGTAVLPYGKLIGGAVSEHAIRIHCRSEVDAGYLFVALRSEHGRRQLKSRAYGSSIPTLDIAQVGQVIIPDLRGNIFEKIGAIGISSAKFRSQAIDLEKEARTIVEHAIEEEAP